MPAPQPINIRYGPDGLLLQAAATAGRNIGENERYERQKARDMAFIDNELNRRSRMAELEYATQQQNQGRELQMAHELALQRGRTPTSGTSLRAQTPFVAAIQQAKSTALQGAITRGDLDAEDPVVQLAAANPNTTPQQIADLIEDRRKLKRDTDKQATQDDLAKQRIEDRKAARGESAEAKQTYYNVQEIDNQVRDIRKRMGGISNEMAKEGFSPASDPSTFNPQVADADAATFGTMGILGSLQDAFVPGSSPSLVSGGNPEAMQQYLLYYQLKRQQDQLLAQRAAAVQAAQPASAGPRQGGVQVTHSRTTGGRPITPQIAAQFLEQAGGDKAAAREMARNAGYSF